MTQHTPDRQQFEIAIQKVGYGCLRRHHTTGVYMWAPTEHAWQGWQAAQQQRDELQAKCDELVAAAENVRRKWRHWLSFRSMATGAGDAYLKLYDAINDMCDKAKAQDVQS